MRRLFWFGAGVAVGAVAMHKLTRTAQEYTPQGIAASLQSSAVGAFDRVRVIVADARAAMAERVAEINAALGRPGDHSDVTR